MTMDRPTDAALAAEIRSAVARINEALAMASRQNLKVSLRTTTHQTSSGVELVVIEAEICKRL